MPRIVVLATGGTISSRTGDVGSVATDSATTLVDLADAGSGRVVVEPLDILRMNSYNAAPADLATIVGALADQLRRPDVDGVVVTHGTDTMEESAYLADLVHDDPRPVVFTGAQRAADHPEPDGPGNLRDAVAVALSAEARDRGVLVAFAGTVLAARGLQKSHTTAPAPFATRGGRPLGVVRGAEVRLAAASARPLPLPPPGPGFATTDVEAVVTYPGSTPVAFLDAVARGARGVVVVGTGSGNPNAALIEPIREATARGVLVALGTRVGDGPVEAIYGGGGAADAVSAGAVPLGTLPWSQARVLMGLLLDHFPVEEARAHLRERTAVAST